jgi:hypothetical protein
MNHYLDEDDFDSQSNRSIDYSERGNFMNESAISNRQPRHHRKKSETSKMTLQDELGMLNLNGDNFGDDDDNDIFPVKNNSDELKDGED